MPRIERPFGRPIRARALRACAAAPLEAASRDGLRFARSGARPLPHRPYPMDLAKLVGQRQQSPLFGHLLPPATLPAAIAQGAPHEAKDGFHHLPPVPVPFLMIRLVEPLPRRLQHLMILTPLHRPMPGPGLAQTLAGQRALPAVPPRFVLGDP